MKWQRVNKYGMQSGDYYVAKNYLDGCSLYVLTYKREQIKVCNDFDECKEEALKHENSNR